MMRWLICRAETEKRMDDRKREKVFSQDDSTLPQEGETVGEYLERLKKYVETLPDNE
ncbi:MAG: hypothetical protein FWG65_10530 [Turicibacter sp.]|nr:hypothetical protein [Turicibacter sp.]